MAASCYIALNRDGARKGTYDISISGGYFTTPLTKELKPTAKMQPARFWTFGHRGACRNGGLHFYVPVRVWEFTSNQIY
jgi:hypothetical protein